MALSGLMTVRNCRRYEEREPQSSTLEYAHSCLVCSLLVRVAAVLDYYIIHYNDFALSWSAEQWLACYEAELHCAVCRDQVL